MQIYHLFACSDYFVQFLLFKRAFSMKTVMLKKTVVRYTNLNPIDVNNDVIFLFGVMMQVFYLHFTSIAVNKFLL